MQYLEHTSFFGDSDFLPEDDIDKLFKKLQPIEPPSSVIARILNSVTRLPHLPQPPEQSSLDEFLEGDGLIVRKDTSKPS